RGRNGERCRGAAHRPARRGTAASAGPVRTRARPRTGRTSGRAERRAPARRRPRPWARVYARRVELSEQLASVAESAARFAAAGETVDAVLVAEAPEGERIYVCAFVGSEGRTWLAFDDRGGPVTQ